MMRRCRWCQVDLPDDKPCRNCRNYADAVKREREEAVMRDLFTKYRSIPFNWQDSNDWRNDPHFLK